MTVSNRDEKIALACRLRQEGFSLQEIGDRIGVSGVTILNWTRGVQKGDGVQKNKRKRVVVASPNEKAIHAIALRRQGLTMRQIAEQVDVNSTASVHGWIKKFAPELTTKRGHYRDFGVARGPRDKPCGSSILPVAQSSFIRPPTMAQLMAGR